ncbi:hypothetical protein HZB88_04165 [archaeon]|nr:hypothetical protein [archaeon]
MDEYTISYETKKIPVPKELENIGYEGEIWVEIRNYSNKDDLSHIVSCCTKYKGEPFVSEPLAKCRDAGLMKISQGFADFVLEDIVYFLGVRRFSLAKIIENRGAGK